MLLQAQPARTIFAQNQSAPSSLTRDLHAAGTADPRRPAPPWSFRTLTLVTFENKGDENYRALLSTLAND